MSKLSLLRALSVLFAATLFPKAVLAGTVTIVDANGTKSFSEIQEAVDAAVDGDILFVAGGSYSGFTISAKGISIFAAPPGVEVRVSGTVRIRDLTGHRVLLSGLDLLGQSQALVVADNTGHVRIHDCYIYGGLTQGVSANLDDNANVVFQNCRVEGKEASFGDGSDGMRLRNSQVALYDTTVMGGKGGDENTFQYAGNGGAGISCATPSWIFGSNSTIRGGDGGDAGFFGLGGDGGPGIALGGSLVPLLNTTVAGGWGGYPNGYYGSSFTGSGSVTALQGSGRRFSLPTIARDDHNVGFSVFGQPGDSAFLWFFTSATFQFAQAQKGVWTIMSNGPFLQGFAPLGVVPVTGFVDAELDLPLLPNPVVRRRYFAQGFVVDAQGSVTLGSPRQILSLNWDSQPDCNANGIQDYAETLGGFDPDCNGNFVPDACDIANGTSLDSNGNGIPDECDEKTHYVDASAPPGGNGSQGHPFQTIRAAIAVTGEGHTVLVADGLYPEGAPTLRFPANRVVVGSMNGPANCIIQGANIWITVADCRLEGFTLQSSGTRVDGDNVTIEDCRFVQSTMPLTAFTDQLLVKGCEFIANAQEGAQLFGGSSGGVTRVVECLFEGNGGSGLSLMNNFGLETHPQRFIISHCVFRENSGGGIRAVGFKVNLTVEDCLIYANTATLGGAGILASSAPVEIRSSTIVDNSTPGSGGGIRASLHAPVVLVNCIVWGNSAPVGPQLSFDERGWLGPSPSWTVAHCAVQGGLAMVHKSGGSLNWGPGNLSTDPSFVGPGRNNYRLSATSPAIDAGDNTSLPPDRFDLDGDGNTTEPVPFDLDWLPRQVEIPTIPNTGLGPPPIVDMGCYERQQP